MLEMWISFVCIWLSVIINAIIGVSTIKKIIKLTKGE